MTPLPHVPNNNTVCSYKGPFQTGNPTTPTTTTTTTATGDKATKYLFRILFMLKNQYEQLAEHKMA